MRDDELLEWERNIYEQRKKKRKKKSLRLKLIKVLIAFAVVAVIINIVGSEAKEIEEPTPPALATIEITTFENTTFEVTTSEIKTFEDYTKIESATITAYCICEKCCGKTEDHPAYGITASGRTAEPFVSVAVDPSVISLGGTVFIDYGEGEVKEFRADDTGGAIKGTRIDVCYPDHQSALEHGVKIATVYHQ